MTTPAQPQMELDFGLSRVSPGYERWQEQRRAATEALARQMGFPLGHEVEIWLRDGMRLRGLLRLKEEKLFVPEKRDPDVELAVGRVPFRPADVESCLRLD